jgi:uncharacterized protein (TIGR03492 family)
MKLLALSNGHGEDVIAVKIIRELQQLAPEIELACLPLVGEGFAYQALNIPVLAPVKQMPSGGFVYMSGQQFWQDVRQGLLNLTISQYQAVKLWANSGGVILAVGDILPLIFAWLSGGNYAFVGTAKSEYYLRDENGWLQETTKFEQFWRTIYYPWERWLMKHRRCQAVFPRDHLTTTYLQKYQIPALDLGNPMMDGISNHQFSALADDCLKIVLLPGSRSPEALNNWQLILMAVESVLECFKDQFILVAAIAPSLSLGGFEQLLSSYDWRLVGKDQQNIAIRDADAILFQKKQGKLIISQNAYADCLHYADLAIAMAGTATEQFVGLGKPAITFAGSGPQYNRQFAQNQGRLLGISLQLVEKPSQVGAKIRQLLAMPDYWQLIRENGIKRLGKAGAGQQIAHYLLEKLR